MPFRLTHDFAAARFAEEGYTLLSRFEDRSTLMQFECPQGHKHKISWNSYTRGHRCAICSSQEYENKIKETFAKEGYKLLSNYKTGKVKLNYVCPSGHKGSMVWSNFKHGKRCPICKGQVVTHEQVKRGFEERGYTLISTYSTAKDKLEFICPNGHRHSILWTQFRKGVGCGPCAKHGDSVEAQEKLLHAEGYTLVDGKTTKTAERISYICPKGHKHSARWGSFKRGKRCPSCKVTGFNPRLPATLYYLRFDLSQDLSVYKIGITNRGVKNRFSEEKFKYCVLSEIRYTSGEAAHKEEQKILRKYSYAKYRGGHFLKAGGHTELFESDVLGLDSEIPNTNLAQLHRNGGIRAGSVPKECCFDP